MDRQDVWRAGVFLVTGAVAFCVPQLMALLGPDDLELSWRVWGLASVAVVLGAALGALGSARASVGGWWVPTAWALGSWGALAWLGKPLLPDHVNDMWTQAWSFGGVTTSGLIGWLVGLVRPTEPPSWAAVAVRFARPVLAAAMVQGTLCMSVFGIEHLIPTMSEDWIAALVLLGIAWAMAAACIGPVALTGPVQLWSQIFAGFVGGVMLLMHIDDSERLFREMLRGEPISFVVAGMLPLIAGLSGGAAWLRRWLERRRAARVA